MSPAPTAAPWTVQALLTWTTGHLSRAGIEEPRLSAEVLLAHAAGWRRIDLYTRFDHVPESAQTDHFRELVRRAAQGEPIAYLVGYKEFFSLRLAVCPAVLIPRPETETLVEFAVENARAKCESRLELPGVNILDLCTG